MFVRGSSSNLELGDDRKMIRGKHSRPAFMHKSAVKGEFFIEINMIEMQQRQNGGKSASGAEMRFRFDGLKIRLEKPGREPSRPFIEIASDDAVPDVFAMIENVRGEQFVHLFAPLEKRRAEVNIKKLQRSCLVEHDLGSQTSARLAFLNADVEILRRFDRQAA